jgi:hypothetical protein
MTFVRLLPAVAKPDLGLDVSAAKHELNVAWVLYKQSTILHYKEGLDFGRVCYEWRARFKAQGSRTGQGFDHLLEKIGIPKTTAYRWIRHYEVKNGLRARRNEVGNNHQTGDADLMLEKRTSFHLLLTLEQRNQFEKDIKTLGGHKKVAEMFVDFVSRSAFEKRRADATIEKAFRYSEDHRRTA